MTTCRPWWYPKFAPLAAATPVYLTSGCALGADGNIQCEPEAMRADAEAQLRAAGWLDSLSLDAYTLARYMQGEVGDGTIEERVAVGEAAVNRGKLEGKGILDVLLYRQPAGHPNRGYYGPIHGPSGVTTAPYGRWATTSANPTLLTVLLADLVTSGQSADFARGADDQDGLEYTAAFPDPAAKVRLAASQGNYWVGPLPGVDHWKTFLWRHYGVSPTSTDGAALLQAGLDAVADRTRPVWPADLPICANPTTSKLWIVGALGLLAGAYAFTRGWLSDLGSKVS
jgi:hypothetical protein